MKGFRMLTLGWSDGNTFLPLSHCLLSSSSKQQQLQGASEQQEQAQRLPCPGLDGPDAIGRRDYPDLWQALEH
uniref:hypothetical protein n=1 Tax=Mitsuokella multacida TaxID=52226 RepID=UPI00216B102B|nr:hypothetical protein [Mitsuokella multacida]